MFSTGFSSGERDGSRMMVRFLGTLSWSVLCHRRGPSGRRHGPWRDVAADLVEMHLHGGCVGEGEHESGTLGSHGTDCAKEVGVRVALIGGQAWPCSLLRPNAHTPFFCPSLASSWNQISTRLVLGRPARWAASVRGKFF